MELVNYNDIHHRQIEFDVERIGKIRGTITSFEIDPSTIPNGMVIYGLRMPDDWNCPQWYASIKNGRVRVNSAGFLICPKISDFKAGEELEILSEKDLGVEKIKS